MRDFERRDRWLERADAAGEALQAARLVSRAELALEERDFGAARDALRSLHGAGPKHIATTRMLLRAERGAGAWDEVLRLAAQLAKRDAIAPGARRGIQGAGDGRAAARARPTTRGAFERRWRGIAAADRAQPRVAAAGGAPRHRARQGARWRARSSRTALDAEWTPQLVALYGELPSGIDDEDAAEEARARIERAERWLLERERDAQLLATLGRLCAQAELWGKARSFLEASLSFEESRAAHIELARLAEHLGQADEAQRHFRRAAELS